MNNIIPQNPAVGTRNGNWMWDGTRWICQPDCDDFPFPQPCPPFGPPVFSGPAGQPPWYPGANGGVSFGATAPPNPVRGHFWFDGTTLWIFDGAAWDPIGPGTSGGVITPPGTTFPPNPIAGQQFFDGKTLWIWDGVKWVPVSQTKTTISATAPSSPNPGDLWFDGTQLHIWDGSAWELVGPGATVGPVPTTTEALALVQPADMTVAAGYTVLPFTATPTIDPFNGWNATTKQYKPNKAGVYLCYGRQAYGGTETQAGWAIAKNDTGTYDPTITQTVASQGFAGPLATINIVLVASGMVKLNGTTDFLRMFAFSDDGTFEIAAPSVPTFEAWILP